MENTNIALEYLAITITVLLIFHCILEQREKDLLNRLLMGMLITNFFALLADLFTWGLQKQMNETIILYVLNFLVYSLGYAIIIVFTYYLVAYIAERHPISFQVAHIVGIFCMLAIVLVGVAFERYRYFSFQKGLYIREPFYLVSQLYTILIVLADMGIIVHYRKLLKWYVTCSFLFCTLLPVAAIVIQIHYPGLTLLYISTTLSALIIYIGIHAKGGEQLKEKELELSRIQLSIMLSQIQPHFLYNSIASIQELCLQNPEKASSALGDFANFLRGSMDSLSSEHLISFRQEMKHVKHYLNLEKIRFEEKLHIEYDIQTWDFLLPPLTIQPLVENAVKYGAGSREEGGIVRIETTFASHCTVVIVSDNGIGIDADSIEEIPIREDGRTHIGLMNVRRRIQEMTGGEIFLTSRKDLGTRVKVIIPERRQNDEHFSSR